MQEALKAQKRTAQAKLDKLLPSMLALVRCSSWHTRFFERLGLPFNEQGPLTVQMLRLEAGQTLLQKLGLERVVSSE